MEQAQNILNTLKSAQGYFNQLSHDVIYTPHYETQDIKSVSWIEKTFKTTSAKEKYFDACHQFENILACFKTKEFDKKTRQTFKQDIESLGELVKKSDTLNIPKYYHMFAQAIETYCFVRKATNDFDAIMKTLDASLDDKGVTKETRQYIVNEYMYVLRKQLKDAKRTYRVQVVNIAKTLDVTKDAYILGLLSDKNKSNFDVENLLQAFYRIMSNRQIKGGAIRFEKFLNSFTFVNKDAYFSNEVGFRALLSAKTEKWYVSKGIAYKMDALHMDNYGVLDYRIVDELHKCNVKL